MEQIRIHRRPLVFLLLTFSSLLSICSSVYADEQEESQEEGSKEVSEPDVEKPKKLRKKRISEENEQRSARHRTPSWKQRDGKNWSVLAGMGLLDVTYFGKGIQFGKFLDPDTIAEIEVFDYVYDHGEGSSQLTTETARVRFFVGNSFNLVAGAGLRQSKSDVYKWSDHDVQSHFRSNSIITEVSLGNRWQFSNFTLGVDWFGLMGPLAKFSSSTSHDADVSDSSRESRSTEFNDGNNRLRYSFVKLQLGAAF